LFAHDPIGLCARCVHAKTVVSAKDSTFWLCQSPMVAIGQLTKYPPLPVHQCPGFRAQGDGPTER